MQKVTKCLILSERSHCIFAPQGFVTKCFLIFIVDEVKNFAANIFFKLVCQSHTGSHASLISHLLGFMQKGGVHILKSSEVLKRQKVSTVSSSTGIVESRDCERPRPRPPFLQDVGPNPHEWVESCYCLSKWRFDQLYFPHQIRGFTMESPLI